MWLSMCSVHRTVPHHQLVWHLETDARQETVGEKTPNPNKKANRDVEELSHVDHVPTNSHSSQSESQLYIFEDSEAVIKMIIKGRSPTMRHVSRTHRVALDWLFDSFNLDSKIQIKYVDNKNQLADRLGSFRGDEWNHLLRLFNTWNLSMFSCSNVFLSNRKQSAMSKRGQEGISEEGSAMAKPRPMILVMAKPRFVNWVSQNLSSTRKKSPQDMSDSNSPGSAKAEQDGVSTSVWGQMRDTSRNPAVLSHARQQEET